MTSVPTYPLHWPQGFPRAKVREQSRFRTDYNTALKNVSTSLRLFGYESGKAIIDPVLSSNIDLNPLAARKDVTDPGVAVWFTWDNLQVCIAVDRYHKAAENLQAIHHILEARRTELRHGTLHLVRATFTGFKALPAPKGEHWRDILGLGAAAVVTRADVEAAFKRKAAKEHPDAGGSHGGMAALNAARTMALQELGS